MALPSGNPSRLTARTTRLFGCAGLCLTAALAGCETSSFMGDPRSEFGRWQYTPTVVPVLDHISAIEKPLSEPTDYSAITNADLVPDPQDYRLGPGDEMDIKIYDLAALNTTETFQRQVDRQGVIELPQLGRLFVAGMNERQAKEFIQERMKKYLADPVVDMELKKQQGQTFAILGQIFLPGSYFIPRPDYRLLEALTYGGRFDETTKAIYVIRSVAIAPETVTPYGDAPQDAAPLPPGTVPAGAPATTPKANNTTPSTATPPAKGDDLLKVIDDLSGDKKKSDKPAPGVLRGSQPGATTPPASATPPPEGKRIPPAVDLVEPAKAVKAVTTPAPRFGDDTTWVFLNGKWQQVQARSMPDANAAGGNEAVPLMNGGEIAQGTKFVDQRVIKIPLKQLLHGDSSLNIIIRPGDVIYVPSLPRGNFYVAGQVQRPGVFQLPEQGDMTILRAITSAGGLTELAYPERAELVRSLGPGRQAIVRLDVKAIVQGTQPDVYIRPDDQVNIGSNFWMFPLSILRNGLRANYGFGFILDRNFGNDVFGVPPEYKSRAPAL